MLTAPGTARQPFAEDETTGQHHDRTTSKATSWTIVFLALALGSTVSALVAVCTGILVRMNGESLVSAVIAGGSTFTGTFLLALAIITVVYVWTGRSG